MDPTQFLRYVIRPTLQSLGLAGLAAERLLLGTALTESGLHNLRQLGGGPALGVFQCEPATHDDLIKNFMPARPWHYSRLLMLRSAMPPLDQLATNLAYATAVCRLHYYREAEPLPLPDDAAGMAGYHKRYYNTEQGATDPAVSIENFRLAIAIDR